MHMLTSCYFHNGPDVTASSKARLEELIHVIELLIHNVLSFIVVLHNATVAQARHRLMFIQQRSQLFTVKSFVPCCTRIRTIYTVDTVVRNSLVVFLPCSEGLIAQ